MTFDIAITGIAHTADILEYIYYIVDENPLLN